jgi:hemolysin III
MVHPRHDVVYSLSEEIAHAVSHGIGIVLSVAGLAVLVAYASLYGNAWHIATAAVFGTTLFLTYTASTLYHAITHPRAKRVLRAIDHATIYLLIAGTYTPLTLVSLRGQQPMLGWALFSAVWICAVAGIVWKSVALGKLPILSVVFYVAMGWCAVLAWQPMLAAIAPGGIKLVVAGGVAYTFGLVFYAWQRMRFHHFAWHLFVLAGSVFHYFAVLLFVIPRPA